MNNIYEVNDSVFTDETQELAHADSLLQREQETLSKIYELERINEKLAKLKVEKETLEKDIIDSIGHNYEGSKSYDIADRSVTVTTNMIYSLDKKLYADNLNKLPEQYNPIVEKVTYEVNKRMFNEYEKSAPAKVKNILGEIVTKKDAKPAVKVVPRV